MKITPEQARLQNKRLILQTIYQENGVSRAQIARITKLTRPTVSDVVANLIEEGLVEESGTTDSGVGRKGILLQVIDDSRYLIGLDLARGDFSGAIINLRGEIKYQIKLPLESMDGEKALQLVFNLLDTLIAKSEKSLLGIGIGAPGLVDITKGIIHHAVNLGWKDIPLRELLQEHYQLPVYMANDCQVAALAELSFGNCINDSSNLVLVNTGWGVGAGIILENQILYGDPFGAGEIGHIVVEEGGELCTCGNRGCLETVVSTRGIVQQAKGLAQENPDSILNESISASGDLTFESICQAVREGDPAALMLMADVGRYLGIAIANLVGVLGGSHVLLAGDTACFGEPFLEIVRREMKKHVLRLTADSTEIGFASLGKNVVLLGASALILPNELGL